MIYINNIYLFVTDQLITILLEDQYLSKKIIGN